MPIEIRELHIRITVDSDSSSGNRAAAGTGATLSPEVQQSITDRCVEQVMDILREKMER